MPNVEVVGLRQANAALRRLPEFVKADAQQVMDVTAFHVAREASAKAPRSVDGSHGHRPGFLASHVTWQRRPRSLSAVVGVLKEAFYWKYVEYGTRKMSARPFLRPAADQNRTDHLNRMQAALERAATKVEQAAQ